MRWLKVLDDLQRVQDSDRRSYGNAPWRAVTVLGVDFDHHPTVPWRSMNLPLPAESGSVASATIASVPSVTVCGPEWALKSVAV
jgi:hypothetical protein